MTGFSWKQDKLDMIDLKIRRAMVMAKSGSNLEFKILHPDWVRDAVKDDYTLLKKVVREDMVKRQKQSMDRRRKRGDTHKDL